MAGHEDVEYTVVLVFPGYGEERENAEAIVEQALEFLNTYRDEPGLRFAPYVTAHLEVVSDVDEAREKLRADDSVAMMILHGLPDDERLAFTHECLSQDVPICRTMPGSDAPRPSRARRVWKVVFRRSREDDEPPAHRVSEATLTGSLEAPEEALMDRVGQLMAAMALGVMEHHHKRNPPRLDFLGPTELTN
jgi:hypothetical protein